MITTPPGLYLGSLILLVPLYIVSLLMGETTPQWCNIHTLRFTNIFYAYATISLLHRILGKGSDTKVVMIALFPLSFFFNYLYYTDVGGLFWVLLMFRLGSTGRYYGSALAGAVSILYRQTNVIWVIFTAIELVRTKMEPDGSSLIDQITGFTFNVLKSFKRTLTVVFPYLIAVLGFAIFVLRNGGAVLGDKSHHSVMLHIPQIYYCSVFMTFFSIPLIPLGKVVSDMKNTMFKSKMNLLVLLLFHLATINYFTYEHPYLTGDNRHFVSILWRHLMRPHPVLKYLWTPVYMSCEYVVIWMLMKSPKSQLACFVLLGSVAMTIIPSPLVEPRYFLVPTVLYLMNIKATKKRTMACLLYYGTMNAGLLWVFLERPFIWPDQPDILQRYMW
jgi:alpha-1,2-glucosyltransferase